jgi:predicted O-methyltransferase YrrM
MDKENVHKIIQRKFHISNKTKMNMPWCSGRRYTRKDLSKAFALMKFKKGAEIGVRRGRFSEILCLDNPKLELYCIDPWDAYEAKYPEKRQQEIYEYAVKRLSKYNVKIIRKPSMEGLKYIKDDELDFVFIDGNHKFDYVMMDIILWSHKVKSGGIVSVHDVYYGEPGILKAVEAYTWSHNIIPWYITKELEPTAYWVKP